MGAVESITMIRLSTKGYIRPSTAGGYVAECPEFEVASQGTTFESARAALEDALRLHARWYLRRGTYESWTARRRPHAAVDGETVTLQIEL